jgi:hypothetical protein
MIFGGKRWRVDRIEEVHFRDRGESRGKFPGTISRE